MAEKDIAEKILLNYNDVFSDIVNALIFKGEQRISPDSLSDKMVHAQYKAQTGKLHEEERDILKEWKECGIEIALWGLENQTKPYRYMPARIIGYDGASYREQLQDKLLPSLKPVVTLVLYFGNKRWTEPTTLKELFGNYAPELTEYVNDYKIHVFEIAWLSEEELNRFHGDFKVVANFFVKKRINKDYIPDDPTELQHVDAVLKLLSVMTGDRRYEEILVTGERRIRTMCEVAERLEKKGIAQGKAEGIAIGKAEAETSIFERVTANYMKADPSLTRQEAEEKARAILR